MTICPKCHGLNISVKFKNDISGEWLEYFCWKCGYKKRERPKDYKGEEGKTIYKV